MATKSTTPTATTTETKPKKPPVPASERLTSQLKRSAVTGKITKDELEKLAELAKALITFVS